MTPLIEFSTHYVIPPSLNDQNVTLSDRLRISFLQVTRLLRDGYSSDPTS